MKAQKWEQREDQEEVSKQGVLGQPGCGGLGPSRGVEI